MRRLFIGTSGWNYPHWEGIFYPDGLAKDKWLEFYARSFDSVELNVTFYRLIKEKTFKNWRNRVPEDFCFVVKGSRFITHIKKIKDIEEPLAIFIDNASVLEKKLAAILWQFPPGFKKALGHLEIFLKLLKKTKIRQVFEFRNETWFDKTTYALLKKYNACLCIAHSGRFPCVREVTADFIYMRFHGASALYSSDYSEEELRDWADFAKKEKNKDIFAFFNNDAYGYALKNALRFRELLER